MIREYIRLLLWMEPLMFGYISTMIDCRMITWFYIIRWFAVIVYQIVCSRPDPLGSNITWIIMFRVFSVEGDGYDANDRLVNDVIYPHTQCNDTVCFAIDIYISRNVWRIVINYSTHHNRYGYGVFFIPGIHTTWTSMSSMISIFKMQRQLIPHCHCIQLRKLVDWTDNKFNKYYITKWTLLTYIHSYTDWRKRCSYKLHQLSVLQTI